MHTKLLQLCPTLCDPTACNPPASSVRFCRQEYWGGFPCTPPRDLPQPRDLNLCPMQWKHGVLNSLDHQDNPTSGHINFCFKLLDFTDDIVFFPLPRRQDSNDFHQKLPLSQILHYILNLKAKWYFSLKYRTQ